MQVRYLVLLAPCASGGRLSAEGKWLAVAARTPLIAVDYGNRFRAWARG